MRPCDVCSAALNQTASFLAMVVMYAWMACRVNKKHKSGEGEIYANECEVTSLGEPYISGTVNLDDFGDSPDNDTQLLVDRSLVAKWLAATFPQVHEAFLKEFS